LTKKDINKIKPKESKIISSDSDINIKEIDDLLPDFGQVNEFYNDPTNNQDSFDESDDRDGSNQEEELEEEASNPREFFFDKFGVYLNDSQYAKIADLIRSKGDEIRKYANKEKFFELLDQEVIAKIKELTGLDPIIKDKVRHIRELKNWYQKMLSKITLSTDGRIKANTRNRFVFLITKDGYTGDVLKKEIKSLSNIRLATARMDDKGNFVGGKSQPKTDTMSFLDYDLINFGLKNKVLYINRGDIVVKEARKTRTGKTYFKLRPGSESDLEFTGDTMLRLNLDFGELYKKGQIPGLVYFLGQRSGDNSGILLGIATKQSGFLDYTREDLEMFLQKEKQSGNLGSESRADEFIAAAIEYAEILKSNGHPVPYGLVASYHERLKNIKGIDYASRFKDIAELYKRLKIDLTEGTMIHGLGDQKLMVVNSDEIRFTVVGPDGKEKEFNHKKADGGYGFDGALFSSHRRMDRINALMGIRSHAIKTFIRFLDPNNKRDYIGLKMAEFVPSPGTRVYKGSDVIATYQNGMWVTPDGKRFDMLATYDEVKDRAGKYAKDYELLDIPEHATRVKLTFDKSKKEAAHPLVAHEMLLDAAYIDNSASAKKFLAAVFKHYEQLIKENVDELYSLLPEPVIGTEEQQQAIMAKNLERARKLREIVYKELKPGQKLLEMDILAEIFPDGEGYYIKSFMEQLQPSLVNTFIVNGAFKGKFARKALATKLLLRPNLGYDIPEDGFMVSPDNTTILKIVEGLFNERRPEISVKDMNLRDKISVFNQFLREEDIRFIVSRQPIQSFTKVRAKRLYGFTEPRSGQTAVFNISDVFQLFDGDHDGDTVHIEYTTSGLTEAMLEHEKTEEFKKRDFVVDLGLFNKGKVGNNHFSFKQLSEFLNDRKKAYGAQGISVNAKVAMSRLSYKDVKVDIDGIKYEVYKPTDRTLMWYWDINEAYLDTIVKYQGKEVTVRERHELMGDSFQKIGDKTYLWTTKEREFALLLQAAVDNDKFNLISKIPMKDSMGNELSFSQFVLGRIFKPVGGSKSSASNSVIIHYTKGLNVKLSNFYNEVPVVYKGKEYASAEHAFQAAKFEYSDKTETDKMFLDLIESTKDPEQAKVLGRRFSLSSEAIEGWNSDRESIMKEILISKFKNNQDLLSELAATKGKEIVHPVSGYWKEAFPRLLAEVRDELVPDSGSISVPENKFNITKNDLNILSKVHGFFNMSPVRRGSDSQGYALNVSELLDELHNYTEVYYDLDSDDLKKRFPEDSSSIVFTKIRSSLRKKQQKFLRSVKINDKITPLDSLLIGTYLRHISKRKEFTQKVPGSSLVGPFKLSDGAYKVAHKNALIAMGEWVDEQWRNDQSNIREVMKGILFGDKIGTAYMDTFSEINKDSSKVLDQGEMESVVKHDYNELIQKNIHEKFGKEWEVLSPIAKKWSTIRFLSGYRHITSGIKIANVGKLLPLQFMEESALREYGKRYFEKLYTSKPQISLRGGDVTANEISKIIANVFKESRDSSDMIDFKKDKYCG
jgi:ribA/ribD-fused uncharacterized protein